VTDLLSSTSLLLVITYEVLVVDKQQKHENVLTVISRSFR